VFDEVPIVAPIMVCAGAHAVPGGVLTASCAVAPAVAPPSPVPAPVSQDPAEAAKRVEAERIRAEMTRPRNEPWRNYISWGRNIHGIPRDW
jgi:hypothetical protein